MTHLISQSYGYDVTNLTSSTQNWFRGWILAKLQKSKIEMKKRYASLDPWSEGPCQIWEQQHLQVMRTEKWLF